MTESRRNRSRPDSDVNKGATEADQGRHPDHPTRPDLHGNLSDQLPHRQSDETIGDSDSDFPEPGSNPEHSGQK